MARTGIGIIQKEREHQLRKWSTHHDLQHTYGSLAVYAAVIATDGTDAHVEDEDERGDQWDLIEKYESMRLDPDEHRIYMLSIAGAFLAAEIDRILLNQTEGK